MKIVNIFLFAFLVGFTPSILSAGTFNWTGGGEDTKWSNPANWSENAAPAAQNDICVFNVAEDLETVFDLDPKDSPVIEKRGAGKLTLGGEKKYNNTVKTGSLFLYEGSIDLGGGKCFVNQSTDGEAAIAAGSSLFNATISYSTSYPDGGPVKGVNLPSGTITLGKGVELTGNSGQMLSYGTAAVDTRTIVLDGAIWINKANVCICGATTSASTVNDGTYKPTVVELKNGAELKFSGLNATVRVGVSFNGVHSPINGAGALKVIDSSVVMNGGQLQLNDVDSTKSGNNNCYSLVEFDNSTLTVLGVYNRPNILTSNRDTANAAHSYAEVVLKDSTATLWSINAMSLPYTGKLVSLLPDGYTGILRLNGSTLIPLGDRSDFIYNSKNAATPAVKLEHVNSVIDTAYDVTVPAVAFGDAGWTKKGEGTLTLSGANIYTGATRVKAGTLNLTGSVAGGIEVAGGTFTTSFSGAFPSLLLDGGVARFTGSGPCVLSEVEIGENGGTLELATKGFAFNNVKGIENFARLTLSAFPAGWGTGDVVFSDSPEFLAWAAEQLNRLLPDGYSASVSDVAVAINTSVESKTTVWNGGTDALWATSENWDKGVPGPADTAVFDGDANTATILDTVASPASVTFAATAGSFSVSGEGSLAVGAGITNLSENLQTFNVPVLFSGVNGLIRAEGDIAFSGGISASSLVKTGSGTVVFENDLSTFVRLEKGRIAMRNNAAITAVGAGSLIVGGTLDLGGGALALQQAENAEPNLLDGAAFTNATVTYTNPAKDNTISLLSGTMTICKDATLNTTGLLFPILTVSEGADYGPRTLIVDGGVLNHTGNAVAVTGVNSDWDRYVKIIVRNGGIFSVSSGTIQLGGYWSSKQTSGSFGEIELDNGNMTALYVRIGDFPKGNHKAILTIRNGSLVKVTRTPQAVPGYCGFDTNERGRSDCITYVLLEHSTIESTRILVKARKYTGSDDPGRESTGMMMIDGGTLRATFGDWESAGDWLVNKDDTTYPAIELLSGGAVIDSQSFNITASAVMYGTGGLEKKGAGTLVISGANTYTGDTVVSEGTLVLASGGALAGPVCVKDGAVFSAASSDTTLASFKLEKGGKIAIPEYEGDSVDLFKVAGEVDLQDSMSAGGKRLSLHPLAAGGYAVRYGRRSGLQVIVR